MWWKTAKVGDKIVCIDAEDRSLIKLGCVYTVDAVYEARGVVFVALCGVHVGESDRGYFVERFRPVQKSNRSTETGFRILKEIAARKREPAKEGA